MTSSFAMDPVSAFGLMGSIMQVIELGSRLVEYSLQIYSAQQFDQDDTSSFKTDVDEITAHLQLLWSTVDGTDVERIVVQCSEYCKDISKIVGSLPKADPSEGVALALYICHKLSPLRQQLPALVLRSIRAWYDLEARGSPCPVPKANVDPYFATCSLSSHIDCFALAGGLRQPRGALLLHLLTSNILASNRELCEMSLKNDILAEIYKGASPLSPPIRMLDPVWEKSMQHDFLQRLCYPGMDDQKAQICDVHATSFSWIMEPSVDTRGDGASFRRWLSNSQSLYWITGKAGSGKSTLMKFILTSLERDLRVNVASFFFKMVGTPIQRSLAGLLRSVLFQVLSQDPRIIPAVAPSRWEALLVFGEDPKPLDLAELQQMLMSALHQRHAKHKTFIVIDGLDEYEECGRHLEILELLHEITACPGVKVCISSRPLPQIRDVIDSSSSLTLEHCTGRDMEEFITFKIEAQLSMTPEASIGLGIKEKLAHELTTRASGCFLWVALVVESLQEKLANGKKDTDLLRFINEVPVELDGLFRSFLDELDASRPFVASTLRFIAMSEEQISLVRLCLMEMHFSGFVLHQEVSSLSQENLYLRTQMYIKRIVSRSKGLLKVSLFESHHTLEGVGTGGRYAHVNLIHRTAREYLVGKIGSSASFSSHGGSYDLAATYCAASLSLLKISTIGDLTFHSVSAEAIRCAHSATFTKTENEEYILRVLDELDRTCHSLPKASGFPKPWINEEQGEVTCDYLYMHQVPIEEISIWDPINPSVAQDDKISARLRQRVIALYLKYGPDRLREAPTKTRQWPECLRNCISGYPIYQEGDFERDYSLVYPPRPTPTSFSRHNILPTDNITIQATGSIESTGPKRLNNEVETPLAQFSGGPLEIMEPYPVADEFHENEPDPNDDSDNMSWESFSSAGFSLDEAHPLSALKAEVTQAVLQGFLEYRQKHAVGQSSDALEELFSRRSGAVADRHP